VSGRGWVLRDEEWPALFLCESVSRVREEATFRHPESSASRGDMHRPLPGASRETRAPGEGRTGRLRSLTSFPHLNVLRSFAK